MPRRHVLSARALGLWIAALLVGGGASVMAERDPATAVIASGGAPATSTTRQDAAPTSTDATTSTTQATNPSVASSPVPSTTSTTAPVPPPPAPAATRSQPTLTMAPSHTLSASGAESFALTGSGCHGERATLRIHGGQFAGDLADYATPAADGSWGIGLMVGVPGDYELRVACTTVDWSILFEYAPVPFTILP